MSTRSGRKRGRPPKTPSLSTRTVSLRKPKAYGGSEPSSRSSTPVSTTSSTPTTRSISRIGTRASARHSVSRSRLFMHNVLRCASPSPDASEGSGDEADTGDPVDTISEPPELSDFDQDELEEDIDAVSEASFDDCASIWSEASFSTVGSTPGKKRIYPRRPKSPEFIEEKDIPPLELPKSSTDLIIDGQSLLRAVSVYEVLRHFRIILRLSPFRFEDFCASLASDEQCCLLGEVHMSLLKVLLREEDGNNTTFGPQDTKDSVNIAMYFLDSMTWFELVRAYLESDPSPEYKFALSQLEKPDYGSLTIPEKLMILQTLTDLFLTTNVVREEIMNEGNIHYDDHCRSCYRYVHLSTSSNAHPFYSTFSTKAFVFFALNLLTLLVTVVSCYFEITGSLPLFKSLGEILIKILLLGLYKKDITLDL